MLEEQESQTSHIPTKHREEKDREIAFYSSQLKRNRINVSATKKKQHLKACSADVIRSTTSRSAEGAADQLFIHHRLFILHQLFIQNF